MYLVDMSELSPEDIAAAAAVHRELGPDYSDAVAESFFEKIDRELDARIDARLASSPADRRRAVQPATVERSSVLTGVKIGIAIAGVPLSVLFLVVSKSYNATHSPGILMWPRELLIIWALIAAVYVIGAVKHRRSSRRR
jgi:hypothetical protein